MNLPHLCHIEVTRVSTVNLFIYIMVYILYDLVFCLNDIVLFSCYGQMLELSGSPIISHMQ